MHEMSITASMLDIVKEHMEKNHLSSLKRLKIEVGKLSALDPQSLLFCFDISIKGTPLEGAVLEVEEIPLRGRCNVCGAEFEMEGYFFICPKCEGCSVEMISGKELEIVSMEAE